MVADLAVTRSVGLADELRAQPLVADPWLRCAVRHPVSLLAGMPAQRIRMRLLRVDTGCVEDCDREHSQDNT